MRRSIWARAVFLLLVSLGADAEVPLSATATDRLPGGAVSSGAVPEGAEFAVEDVTVCEGSFRGVVEVTYTSGPTLDGASHVLHFDADAPIASDDEGAPLCAPIVPLGAADATFTFLPDGCGAGIDCDAVQVFLRGALSTVPPGTPLYRCEIDPVPSAALGRYPLRCTDARARYDGIPDLTAVCEDGSFTIEACATSPTPEATITPTATQPPPTATATIRDIPSGGGDDGGCAVVPAAGGAGWPLLIGLAAVSAVIWRRSARDAARDQRR